MNIRMIQVCGAWEGYDKQDRELLSKIGLNAVGRFLVLSLVKEQAEKYGLSIVKVEV